MKILNPKIIREWNDIRKKNGFIHLFREKGSIVLIIFFLYYLIRDSILYILIPFMVAKEIITCV